MLDNYGLFFSSAGWAIHISWPSGHIVCTCLRVWMLTRVAQIITAAHIHTLVILDVQTWTPTAHKKPDHSDLDLLYCVLDHHKIFICVSVQSILAYGQWRSEKFGTAERSVVLFPAPSFPSPTLISPLPSCPSLSSFLLSLSPFPKK